MAEVNYLEDELERALASTETGSRTQRNRSITRHYFGFDGAGGCSMEKAGKPYMLTRESVRQITNRVVKSMLESRPRTDVLEAIAERLEALIPIGATEAERILQEEGYTRGPFRLEGILNAFRVFGVRFVDAQITACDDALFLVPPKLADRVQKVLSRATKEVSHNGACSVGRLRAEIPAVAPENKDRFIRSIVESKSGCQWIDTEHNWFYFGTAGRNRLLDRMRKVFSFVERAAVKDLRKGIQRSWNKNKQAHTHVLPANVILALLESTGEYRVEPGGIVHAVRRGDPGEALRPIELAMAEFIRSSDAGLRREKEMEDALVESRGGDGKFGFAIALNYSPLFVRRGRGKYTLVGRPYATG
jgi:hypothetical protein